MILILQYLYLVVIQQYLKKDGYGNKVDVLEIGNDDGLL
jgi:hypothetical protein